jgi:hypothetical protein
MTQIDLCREIAEGMGTLFECSPHGKFVRIRTPFLYPDGDIVDLFCKLQGDVALVTDLGETTRWLRMQTVSPRRSPKQKLLIEDTCLTHGVEFYRGMLLARCRSGDSLPDAVNRVAQASLRAIQVEGQGLLEEIFGTE